MYLSKIWFFLVAVAAGVALTVSLVMPRPAERRTIAGEAARLQRACKITTILMQDNARIRVQLAGEFARTGAPEGEPTLRLDEILFNAARGEIISANENKTGRRALDNLLKVFIGEQPPDFVLLLDRRGRVVARKNKGEKGNDKYAESLRGYYLVDDALAGYLRDDLWALDDRLYRVAGSPVVTANNADWAGAVIVGHALDNDFAKTLSTGLGASLGFYVGGTAVASTDSVAFTKEVVAAAEGLPKFEASKDCEAAPFEIAASGKTYSVLVSPLPGEAGELGAFVAVYFERKAGLGFMGTLKSVSKGDLSFANFPWIPVVLAFLILLGVGIFLMIWEADRPLRRLADDSQRLSQGGDKLIEEQHRGKFGSIARSVNVGLDRLRREAKSAQKDLDELLGPAPVGAPMPAMAPAPMMMPPPPPPPSQFRFGDEGQAIRGKGGLHIPAPPPPAAAQAPVNRRIEPRHVGLPGAPPVVAPLEMPTEAQTVERMNPIIEDMPTIVSEESMKIAHADSEALHFRDIYEEFLQTKRQCGEPADNLNFERFAAKLRRNRDALIAQHGCRSVRFQVYVKDGKAALKASPEK